MSCAQVQMSRSQDRVWGALEAPLIRDVVGDEKIHVVMKFQANPIILTPWFVVHERNGFKIE